jgi:hypothetical protein
MPVVKRFESEEEVLEGGRVFYEVEYEFDFDSDESFGRVEIRRIWYPIYPHGNNYVEHKLVITAVNGDICFETFETRQDWGGTGSDRLSTLCLNQKGMEGVFFLDPGKLEELNTAADIRKFIDDIIDWISETATCMFMELLPEFIEDELP